MILVYVSVIMRKDDETLQHGVFEIREEFFSERAYQAL